MQVKLFTISLTDDGSALEEMNQFLRVHKIIDMTQHFYSNENGASLTYSIRYLGKANAPVAVTPGFTGQFREKIDYMQVLDSDTFVVFAKMREVRKAIAKEDGVAAYAVFTDAEMAELAKLPTISLATMQSVKGIGEKKIAKFGERFIKGYQA